VKGKGIRLVDLFPLLVPRYFEVVFAKFFQGVECIIRGVLRVCSFTCLTDQELCIGQGIPLNTIAHSGVHTRITILKITFQGKLVFQGHVKGTEQVSLGAPLPRA
jgi:hypothetical protein